MPLSNLLYQVKSILRTLQSNEPKKTVTSCEFRIKVFLQLQIINTQPHHSPTTARNGLTYALIPYIYRIVPSRHSSRDRSHSSAQPARKLSQKRARRRMWPARSVSSRSCPITKKKKRPRKGLSIQKPPKAKTINKKAEKTNECGRTQPPEAE